MTATPLPKSPRWLDRIDGEIRTTAANFERLREHAGTIASAADVVIAALRGGGKVLLCGNGGSAADAQHLAAEFMGRYLKDRAPLPALALTVDTSALTAIANDYSFEDVFARQLRGIGRRGDVLIGISTSGNSANVVKAVETAKGMGISTVALMGQRRGRLADIADVVIEAPSERTNEIQEMHIAIGHILCGIVEDDLC